MKKVAVLIAKSPHQIQLHTYVYRNLIDVELPILCDHWRYISSNLLAGMKQNFRIVGFSTAFMSNLPVCDLSGHYDTIEKFMLHIPVD